jgi:hypothetical protein
MGATTPVYRGMCATTPKGGPRLPARARSHGSHRERGLDHHRHGGIGFGEQIEIRQGAEIGRPPVLYATGAGAGDRIDSVEVGGSALIVAEGRFRVAPA